MATRTGANVQSVAAQDIVRHDLCMKRRSARQNIRPARALKAPCGQTISALTGKSRLDFQRATSQKQRRQAIRFAERTISMARVGR
jgi:glucose-6-phosphate-specific signal transduction histidine kinase